MIAKGVKLSLILILAGLVGMAGLALADDDGDEGHFDGGRSGGRGGYSLGGGDNDGGGFFKGGGVWKGSADVAGVEDKLYTKECGACHFAYQPGLLPARSWEKVMAGLEDHFGDNAELASEDQKSITDYLIVNSADKSGYKASVKIIRSLGGETPLRITNTPYFVHEHREIPENVVKGNPKVKSLSHCDRCHTNAASGFFNEHEVSIPGHGKWED